MYPGMDNGTRRKIDNSSTQFGSQAHSDGFCAARENGKTQTQASKPNLEIMGQEYRGQTTRPSMVRMFQKCGFISLRWAIIRLHVVRLRRRQTWTPHSTPFFSINIDIIPRCFVSIGLSLSYTNAPDDAGYYNICPRISISRVLPLAPVWKAIENDDVDVLQHILENGEVSVRDCDKGGNYLLEHILDDYAVKCLRKYCTESDPVGEDQIRTYEMLRNFGSFSGPFAWWPSSCRAFRSDISIFEFHLELHLKIGADFNAIVEELVLLECAIEVLSRLAAGFEWGQGEGDNASFHDGNTKGASIEVEEADEAAEVTLRLLILTIDAGADVSFVREVNGHVRSITDFAVERGIEDYWEEAPRTCGYDPVEVREENERRRKEYKRLNSAGRSGVDVEAIRSVPSTRGLRRRATAGAKAAESSVDG
ncbi:uncharacterized protein F4822DRAFT_442044 [Hypoxylon trugodes]|uniref:uncharacterized protein n=1 Tax=Hypoxylon trugodes TaxID=326681 RepID=UPI00218E0BCB|nr:uncharacterized protein F4822DRAFT_442044 [Hypoxylon trugodes]KAI1390779.1 hypothetical protein F4822DRAFT_442044 [Hypoxylon trugodes]